MTPQALKPQATYLYGIIVGLSIRESLIQVVPQLTSATHNVEAWSLELQCFRLLLFLTTIIRFYLGSVSFFDEVHNATTADQNYTSKNYGLDFIVGLIHFVFFYAWATTINDVKHRDPGSLSHFTALAGVVLAYDVVWLVVSLRYSTRNRIGAWTVINLLTIAICGFLIFVPLGEPMTREQLAIVAAGIIGIIDIAGLIDNCNPIADRLVRLFSSASPVK